MVMCAIAHPTFGAQTWDPLSSDPFLLKFLDH